MPALRSGGVRAVAANGVLGDAAGASAEEGRALLARAVAELVAFVDAWRVSRPQPDKPATEYPATRHLHHELGYAAPGGTTQPGPSRVTAPPPRHRAGFATLTVATRQERLA